MRWENDEVKMNCVVEKKEFLPFRADNERGSKKGGNIMIRANGRIYFDVDVLKIISAFEK